MIYLVGFLAYISLWIYIPRFIKWIGITNDFLEAAALTTFILIPPVGIFALLFVIFGGVIDLYCYLRDKIPTILINVFVQGFENTVPRGSKKGSSDNHLLIPYEEK